MKALLAVAVVAVSMLPAGCGEAPSAEVPQEGATEPVQDVQADADAEWLSGAWDVDVTLDVISEAIFAEDAGEGPAVATISADEEGAMTLEVDDVVYSGVVVFGGVDFRFEGSALIEDEPGSYVDSDVVLDGVRTTQDSWDGELYGRVSSEGEYLYEASWTLAAQRRE
jgi:hypothetical protein